MKKYILALAIAMGFTLPAYAWDLGNGISLDTEIEAAHNIDKDTTSLTMESGMTVPIWILSANVNADFDIKALGSSSTSDLYQGLDLGLDYNVASGVKLELDTGIDTDWAREDITLSMTVSF
jgi:hypothetical protein